MPLRRFVTHGLASRAPRPLPWRVLGLAAVIAVGLGLGGCDRPGLAECEKVCWHVFELTYWKQAELEIAAAPREQREALRADKERELAALKADPDYPNPKICAEQCNERGSSAQVECQLAATTVDEAKACEK